MTLQTANLLREIRQERFHKIDMGLKALEGPITVKLNNVSAMECNMIRHSFQGALNQFYRLSKVTALPTLQAWHLSRVVSHVSLLKVHCKHCDSANACWQ